MRSPRPETERPFLTETLTESSSTLLWKRAPRVSMMRPRTIGAARSIMMMKTSARVSALSDTMARTQYQTLCLPFVPDERFAVVVVSPAESSFVCSPTPSCGNRETATARGCRNDYSSRLTHSDDRNLPVYSAEDEREDTGGPGALHYCCDLQVRLCRHCVT